ncbi:o-succinylbenzoate synthase [Muriicola jejuensis]|uniref:O-succinylbenzoate synthase n=1 Tax=Muriicola jejuensis TaxID=504488 RepID=A0A6P0UCX5_9FLAO|nr:o-succinylbenzoate synthase [Muriicola jejuensis]NER11131.1 o-succinylbenzoate synthase [Muriicola jejuensis]SMP23963.1 o-succinylbenzoate synthase [Muriicola jejuensis]
MKASFKKHVLQFISPGGTSRGILTTKETWFLVLRDGNKTGIGECGMFRGLSYDDVPDYEQRLQWACLHIGKGLDFLLGELRDYPSIQFGLEQAFRSLEAEYPFLLYPSAFTDAVEPIPINGLIWMGNRESMEEQLRQKVAMGFHCLKLKIGAIDFNTELDILRGIRADYSKDEIELRVDANGAFGPEDAFRKLEQLATLDIHSIEQPVKPGQYQLMKSLCEAGLVDIALDEELIGLTAETKKRELLQIVKPHYLILKPSLVGGFRGSREWITLAREFEIGWWVTSALESNIGLNAIAQWTFTLQNPMPQGLGTGQLFSNNVESPLEVTYGELWYRKDKTWKTNFI